MDNSEAEESVKNALECHLPPALLKLHSSRDFWYVTRTIEKLTGKEELNYPMFEQVTNEVDNTSSIKTSLPCLWGTNELGEQTTGLTGR